MAIKLNKLASALIISGLITSSAFAAGHPSEEMVDQNGNNVLVGYWHNWADGRGYQGGNAPGIELNEVAADYNVVDVSFMKVYDLAEGRIPTFKLDPVLGMSEQQFIDQIGELNNQGRSVLLALGGADAHIELQTGDEQAFADEVIRLVDIYGFDGLDIDLEQAAIYAGDNETVIPAALRLVKDHYRDLGDNFMITMAPEFPYLTAGGKYAPYIDGLEGYYDFINPQFYNQGGDGLWVDEENAWITQNNDDMKEDFIYYISDSLANGTRGFMKIPANKLVFGIPSSNDAAATGFVKDPTDLYRAFEKMEAQGQPLKGIMTWSINWDMGTDASGQFYDSQFVKDYGPFIHGQAILPVVDSAPVILGVSDTRVILESESFDSLTGITAIDSEDGNLTDSIEVAGNVDLYQEGDYNLTYSVEDSAGQITTENRKVTVFVPVVENALPSINGTSNQTIMVDAPFDPMANVTADDLEDGNLTDDILVEGNVNTSIAGQYQLTYSVTDTGGQEVIEVRTITVKAENTGGSTGSTSDNWDATAVYTQGDKVTQGGIEYTAKWWNKNNTPELNHAGMGSDAWERITPVQSGESNEWNEAKIYNGGDQIDYNGDKYEAKWWTKGDNPETSDVWILI